jgi:hypothetical protein
MAGEEQASGKLRDYLRELTPEARSLLMAELERARLRGDELPQADLLLQELRTFLQGESRLPERIGNPARLFFSPVEAFLVDEAAERHHYGRLPRACIDPIWDWICNDLAPAEATAYSTEVSRLLLAKETGKAEQAARAFQNFVVRRIDDALATARRDDKTLRQLAFRVGTPRAQADVREFANILRARDALGGIAARIPQRIRNLAGEQLDAVLAILDGVYARQHDLLAYALVLVMGRLPAHWQLVRLAIRSAQSDAADRIADTPYAGAVTIVLDELERLVRELNTSLKRGQVGNAAAQLKAIHEAVRGLRAEMDLSVGSAWARQLAAIRAGIADCLKPELDAIPGRVRRIVRILPGRQTPRGATVDADEVAEVEAMLEFLSHCRACASELALNEITMRIFSDLQNFLESGTKTVLDALRIASDAERAYRQAQFDAAVRFCAKVFGSEYATLLARAGEVAANTEDKVAKG